MGQRKDCLVKYAFFAVLMLVLCGCAQCDRLVLSTGESVETLYYHECRMPDEVMTEMWIDFPSRRLRVKCGLHDALGWNSSLCDGVRLDVCLEDGEWRRLVRKLRRAELEAWPDVMSAEGDAGASSWYLRMTSVGRNVEKFRPREMPAGAEYMREIVRGEFERGGHFSVACDNGRAH